MSNNQRSTQSDSNPADDAKNDQKKAISLTEEQLQALIAAEVKKLGLPTAQRKITSATIIRISGDVGQVPVDEKKTKSFLADKRPATEFFMFGGKGTQSYKLLPSRKSRDPDTNVEDNRPALWATFNVWKGAGAEFHTVDGNAQNISLYFPRRLAVHELQDVDVSKDDITKYGLPKSVKVRRGTFNIAEIVERIRTHPSFVTDDAETPSGEAFPRLSIMTARRYQKIMQIEYDMHWDNIKRREAQRKGLDRTESIAPGRSDTGHLLGAEA